MRVMEPNEVMKRLDETITMSSYFTWGEALWMGQSQAYALPSTEQIHNIINMAQALDKVRAHYGRPITVLSWLRTPAHNKLVGGALKSAHLDGMAVDFVIPGINLHKCREELNGLIEVWPYRIEQGTPTWIHVDLRSGTRKFYP